MQKGLPVFLYEKLIHIHLSYLFHFVHLYFLPYILIRKQNYAKQHIKKTDSFTSNLLHFKIFITNEEFYILNKNTKKKYA